MSRSDVSFEEPFEIEGQLVNVDLHVRRYGDFDVVVKTKAGNQVYRVDVEACDCSEINYDNDYFCYPREEWVYQDRGIELGIVDYRKATKELHQKFKNVEGEKVKLLGFKQEIYDFCGEYTKNIYIGDVEELE